MSAIVIPLTRQSELSRRTIRLDAIEKLLAADPADALFDGMRVRLLLEELYAREDTLLSVIESMRTPSLRTHPDLGRSAAHLEATSIQALVEIGLLIRQGTASLRGHQKDEV